MNKWKMTELGNLLETLKGFAFKSSKYVKKGIPIVRVTDFTDNSISDDNLVYYSDEDATKYGKYTLFHNDIIIQTVGSWQSNPASIVGKVVRVPKIFEGALLNQNAVKLIPNYLVNKEFLYYRLKENSFKYYNLGCAQGAANQASITLKSIRKFKFKLPPLIIQCKIASMLSNYDDLIENRIKQIKLLEEVIIIIYELWFNSNVIINKHLTENEIEFNTLEEIIEFTLNGGWGKDFNDNNHCEIAYVIRGTDIPDVSSGNYNDLPLRYHTKKNLETRTLKNGDIILEISNGNIDNVGRNFLFDDTLYSVLNEKIICASFCKMLRPKSISHSYIIATHLKYIHKSDKMLVYKSQGANGINNFRCDDMLSEESIPIPKGKYFDILVGQLEPLYKLINNLCYQIKLLKEARDILLTRLMTGIIKI